MKSIVINKKEYYFYLTVCFKDSKKKYYYISLDTTIQIGDYVIVKTQEGLDEVRVLETKFYSLKDVPYPIEHTKLIIAKIENKENDKIEYLTLLCKGLSMLSKPLIYRNVELERLVLPFCDIEDGVLKGIKTCGLSTIYIPQGVIAIENLIKFKKEKIYNKYEYGEVFEGEYDYIQDANYDCLVELNKLFLPPSVKAAFLHDTIEDLYLSEGIENLVINSEYVYSLIDGFIRITNPHINRLKRLTIPKSLVEIECRWDQFKEIIVNTENPIFKFNDGLLYKKYKNDVASKFHSKNILNCRDRKYDGDAKYKYEIVWKNPKSNLKTVRINENVIIPRVDILKGVNSLIIEEGVEFIHLPQEQYSVLNISHIKIPKSLKHIDMEFDMNSLKKVISKFNSEVRYSPGRIVFETIDLNEYNESFCLENGNLYWYNSTKTDFLLIAEKII